MATNMKWAYVMALSIAGAACAPVDPSTLVTDDNGVVHRTTHYLNDKRGQDYFPVKIPGTGKRQFVYDPRAYAWAAYDEEGNRVMTGAGTGGKDICEEDGKSCRTVTGTFKVYTKRGENCRSGEYPVETHGGTKMPYCMYFYQGYTVHAGFDIPFDNVSHGCIRVWPSAAKWLNEEFLPLGATVTILPYKDQDAIKAGPKPAPVDKIASVAPEMRGFFSRMWS